MRIRLKTIALAATTLTLTAVAPLATLAQTSWPDKAVTLIVPYPPGGTSDIVGRQLAQKLGEELGQTVIVENKAGAATAIGATAVARSAKDGYTLLLSAGTTFTVIPHLNDKLAYKLDDFEPVATVATVPFAFVVKKDFPAKTLPEFVAYGKAHPGKINNATNGQGSMVHLMGEMIAQGTGVKMVQIHYKGAAPAMMDLMAGTVDSNVEALPNTLPNVAAGQYRALAVLSTERLPLLPDVPTFKELGYPQVAGETWYAVFAPAGTPKAVTDKLGGALRKVTGSPAFAENMRKIGADAKPGTAAELKATTMEQSRMWGELIKRLDIKAN